MAKFKVCCSNVQKRIFFQTHIEKDHTHTRTRFIIHSHRIILYTMGSINECINMPVYIYTICIMYWYICIDVCMYTCICLTHLPILNSIYIASIPPYHHIHLISTYSLIIFEQYISIVIKRKVKNMIYCWPLFWNKNKT